MNNKQMMKLIRLRFVNDVIFAGNISGDFHFLLMIHVFNFNEFDIVR